MKSDDEIIADPFDSEKSSVKSSPAKPVASQVASVSEDMEDLELQSNPKRRNRKRRLVREESEESRQPDISVPEQTKRQIKDDPIGGLKNYLIKGKKASKNTELSAQDKSPGKNKKKMCPKGKKRVLKERITEDAKGYTVVEEYSEYEDMTPEEIAKENEPKKPVAKKQ